MDWKKSLGVLLSVVCGLLLMNPLSPATAQSSKVELQQIIGVSELTSRYRPVTCILGYALETLGNEPEYSSRPRYGALQLGNGEDSLITIAVDEPWNARARIYIDKNNDEDLTNDGEGAWDEESRTGFIMYTVVVETDYTVDGMNQSKDYAFTIYRFKEKYPDRLFYYRDCYMEGSAELAGKSYRIAILDDDTDGLYDDLSEGGMYIDVDSDGELNTDSDSHEYYSLDMLFNVAGESYNIESVAPDGSEISITVSPNS